MRKGWPLCPSQAADNSARAWSDCLASTGLTRLDIGPGGRVTIPSKKEWHGYLFSVSLDISNNAPESSSSMEFCRHPGGRGFSKSDPYLTGMESYMYHSKPKRALEKVRLTYRLKDTVLFSWANWSGMMRLVWQPYASLVLFLYNYVYSRLAQSRVLTVSVSRSALHRRGSRTNTDRFPKRAPKAQDSRAGGGGGLEACSPLKFFRF